MLAHTRIGAVTCALALASPALAAADIYKCVRGDATSYQATPCAGGQAETLLRAGGAQARPVVQSALAVTEPPAREAPRRAGPWRNRIPVLGITDDEVLNLPGWGPPSSIARTRLSRGWREVWTYNQPATGLRELHFTNARLSEIVEPPAQIARLTLQ